IPGKNTEPFTHIPEGVSFEQAAVLPVPAITSYGSLDLLALSPGQSVVILGALGGVGGYAIEMSKLRGLYIIATVRGDTEEALRLGAKEAYDINQADVYPAIHK